jgi:hypothetical protein
MGHPSWITHPRWFGLFGVVGLVEGVDEVVGFGAGVVDALDEVGDVGLDAGGGVFERADGAGVEVVLEEEDLVVEGGEDGGNLVFGLAHGDHVGGLAGFGVAEQGGALGLEPGVFHVVDLALPLFEEIFADVVDGLDLVVELGGLAGGVFVAGVEALVVLLERAALEAGDGLEVFHRGLELLFGLLLIFLGVFDAGDEDVALLFAEGAHGFVEEGGASGEGEGGGEEQEEGCGFAGHLARWPRDDSNSMRIWFLALLLVGLVLVRRFGTQQVLRSRWSLRMTFFLYLA